MQIFRSTLMLHRLSNETSFIPMLCIYVIGIRVVNLLTLVYMLSTESRSAGYVSARDF